MFAAALPERLSSPCQGRTLQGAAAAAAAEAHAAAAVKGKRARVRGARAWQGDDPLPVRRQERIRPQPPLPYDLTVALHGLCG